MVVRFCLYSILKNLRFFEPFFLIYLLAGPAAGGPSLRFFEIGLLVGYQGIVTGVLEIPFGIATDRFGRRRALMLCFATYTFAFPMYAIASEFVGSTQLAVLYLAQTLFGIGEALRTGSHKAIMLDWIELTGRSDEASRLLAVTRFCSKTSAGVSAFAGGLIVYSTGSFGALFWAATVPAALGVVLLLTYPNWLEGEQSRSELESRAMPWAHRFRKLWAVPGVGLLLIESALFESQIKLAQHYLQPFLRDGLVPEGAAIAGGFAAVWIGTFYLFRDGLGGVSSIASIPLERMAKNRPRALLWIYRGSAVAAVGISLSLFAGWLWLGLAGFLVLAFAQNARRPTFVAELNRSMDKPQRATTLSIESQARSWSFAVLAPTTGWLADTAGLSWAVLTVPIVLLALLLHLRCREGAARFAI